MDAIIFDIDGTLADVEHRRHHVSNGKKDWDKFFDEMVNDPPIKDVCWLAELVATHLTVRKENVHLFVFSGRPESHREETRSWMTDNVPNLLCAAEDLLMRKKGDYRPDTVVKKEMLEHIQGKGFNVRLVIDDRPSVVQMWKDNGITVLQHDSGEWDGVVKTWKPGALHLMVGPSGAGKTTFLNRYYPALGVMGDVVSSDALREKITGKILDQSANTQVFAALHAITKARIENGLTTVVDATNLRAADRRKLRDLCPNDTVIHYHVIDRPLNEKVRDGGWRNNVAIGKEGHKETLITAHDKRFKSALKHILAGDNDPRVTVHDMRGHSSLKRIA